MADNDSRVLPLFENASPVDTPTPGVKAWIAGDAGADSTVRPVIIKRLRDEGTRKARATEALHLRHLNILPPRKWLADGGHIYVVRDVVRGKNMRQALTTANGERPGPELLRKLLLPLADALAFAHSQGVVHGGVSPENILIAEDGRLLLVDFATVDPNAPRHQPNYQGNATVAGDVRGLGATLAAYLPNTGAFANVSVRGRIEGLIGRCDTLADLREILNSLERLAAAPTPGASGTMARPKDGVPTDLSIGMPRLEIPNTTPPAYDLGLGTPTPAPNYDLGIEAKTAALPDAPPPPPLTVTVMEKGLRVPQGGGGILTVSIRNDGPKPLVLRMVATQHPWLNARPVALPLTIAVSSSERIEFSVSAARLSPGEYRSEIYLSVNTAGDFDEPTNTGWHKHTSEVRVTVEAVGPALPPASGAPSMVPGPMVAGGQSPFPANAPKISGGAGCATLLALCALPLVFYLVQLFQG